MSDRKYAVVTSGHGSNFRFEGADPNTPPPGPHHTLEEAIERAQKSIGSACTIGGDAQVVHVETLEIHWPKWSKGKTFEPRFGKVARPDGLG